MDLEDLIELVQNLAKRNPIYDLQRSLEYQLDIQCSDVTLRKYNSTFTFSQIDGPVGSIRIEKIDYLNRQAYVFIQCGRREALIRVESEYDERKED